MSQAPRGELLFVYGTLGEGSDHPLARRLRQEAEDGGPARARGWLLDGGAWPAWVPGDGEAGWVHGRCFALPAAAADALLRALDRYEGCTDAGSEGPLFRRERCVVRLEAGGTHEAWIYRYARPTTGMRRIRGGRWSGAAGSHVRERDEV